MPITKEMPLNKEISIQCIKAIMMFFNLKLQIKKNPNFERCNMSLSLV